MEKKMTEYVERKAILKAYQKEQGRPRAFRFETLINSVQAADVAPVVHARWEMTDNFAPMMRCTNCRYQKPMIAGEVLRSPAERYCPNCGAKMDADELQKGAY